MKRLAALLLLLATTLPALRAETPVATDPASVTKAAYATAMAHFGFTAETLRHEKPYLAADLYAALLKKANQPTPKGDAPDIEGDVILNSQDLPNKYSVDPATISGPRATVPVTLVWGTENRRYLVYLTQLKSGSWKIADIDYGKDEKLSDLLK
jgi:hypothetical protein